MRRIGPLDEDASPLDAGEAQLISCLLGVCEQYLAAIRTEADTHDGDWLPVCEESGIVGETLDEYASERYYDENSGKELEPRLVEEARKTEIETIDTMKVWEVVPRPKEAKLIRTLGRRE